MLPAPLQLLLHQARTTGSAAVIRRAAAPGVTASRSVRSASDPPGTARVRLLSRPPCQYRYVTHEGTPAGVVDLEPSPGGDMQIIAFGLLPERVGTGLGGYALTLALRQAWGTEAADVRPVRRVWLHTSTDDHPNAFPDDEKRGLRVYRREVQP